MKGTSQGNQTDGKEVRCQNDMSLCKFLFNSFTDIIAFLSKDGDGAGKADELATQTEGSEVCFNIIN